MKRLIALILYMGQVTVSSFERYWSTKTLYHGLWARQITSRDRFKALMHVVDPVAPGDKLRQVRAFLTALPISARSFIHLLEILAEH